MVNHFATLLGNLPLVTRKLKNVPYALGDTDPEIDEFFSSDDGASLIALEESYTSLVYSREESLFTNRHFTQLNLPPELENFHKLLFPPTASLYYKHFLLYCYLRVIAGTSLSEATSLYDSRVSYDLKEVQEYFRFNRVSSTLSSDPNYHLVVKGDFKADETISYHLNNFVIRQIEASPYVLVYSTTQGLYYPKQGPPSTSAENMSILLELDSISSASKPVNIGDTGLSFFITGPFDSVDLGIGAKSDRTWSFTSESELTFNLLEKLQELERKYAIVDNMLAQRSSVDDESYRNVWNMHFNPAYRFSALLVLFVNRVNILWQSQT